MPERGRVTATDLNVRDEASAAGRVIGRLEHGAAVAVRERHGGWLRIRFGEGEAYVSADHVALENVKKGTVKATRLNVRDRPSTEGGVLGGFTLDATVDVLESLGDWLRVKYGGGEGFVSAAYVAVDVEVRTGKVIASALNLRDAPEGSWIGSLSHGTPVDILGAREGWLRVEAGGQTGWVSGDYVEEVGAEGPTGEAGASSAHAGFRVEGRDVFGPDGERFARTYRLGIFSSGTTSIEDFVGADPVPGLSGSKLNVMRAVSRNEGNLDAINTWDNAFLTFGCFQWTAGTTDGPGELPALVDRLIGEDEEAFDRLLGRFGLNVTRIRKPVGEPPRGYFSLDGEMLRRSEDKERLRDVSWAYRFKLAGQDRAMQRVEVFHAAERVDLFYRSEPKRVGERHVADYVSSEYGVALLLDQHVNRPSHVPRTLKQAVDAFVEERGGADDPETWGDDDEARLLEIYVALRNETSMTDAQARADRTKEAVESGAASAERGSYVG